LKPHKVTISHHVFPPPNQVPAILPMMPLMPSLGQASTCQAAPPATATPDAGRLRPAWGGRSPSRHRSRPGPRWVEKPTNDCKINTLWDITVI
jgi:hypothetical protein